RQSALELDPLLPAVEREEEPELRAREEEVRLLEVLRDRVDGPALRQVARDRGPRRALVVAPVEMRREAAALVVVERREDDVLVEPRREEVRDIRLLGDARRARSLSPGSAAVVRHLHEAVVGADPEEPFLLRGLAERDDVS